MVRTNRAMWYWKSAFSALSDQLGGCLHRNSKLILPNYVLDLANFACRKEVSKCITSSKTGDAAKSEV